MDKNYIQKKEDSEENGFIIAIVSVGIALVGIGTYLAVELLFP